MKKGLIVLCAMILIIASAIACWPRMAVQEDTTFALVFDLDTRDVYVPLGAEDSAILRDILVDALRLPDWTNTIPGQRFYYDDWHTCGILVCGTGVGMSMVANKYKGIRAACCSDTFSARMTRAHNDANILCFGARVVGYGLACDLVDAFLATEFEGGRHQTRVDMITDIESK